MSKRLICTCEDVLATDVEHALAQGYRDIESLKRYTGFGTGACQGKNCISSVAKLLASPQPFTARPPQCQVDLNTLKTITGPSPGAVAQTQPWVPPMPIPESSAETSLPEKAKVVIIGGGIMGLALAHNLALRGETDVVVLESGYLCAGASGRNGGGVRMQWGTAINIEWAKRSIELMKSFAAELKINIWLRQGGYLFLAQSDAGARRMEKYGTLQRRMGLNAELISLEGARELVPQLDLKSIKLCAYNPDDGVIFPWPFLWGYADACRRKGVRIETFTEVTGFELSQQRIKKVLTSRGSIACDTVVLAAGAWSPKVAALAGIELPNRPYRHEILSLEPLKPFLGPLVSVLDSGLYFSQSARGEVVAGMGNPLEPPGLNLESSFEFLQRIAGALTERMPLLGSVKVVRQWAGCYDLTPDNNPILGRTPGLPNLLQMSGFVGHGFMMAPAVAERMAAWMAGETDDIFSRFNLERFERATVGGTLHREEMIIG